MKGRVNCWVCGVMGVGIVMMMSTGSVAAQEADPCVEPANWIIAENCKPGNPSTEWDINGAGDMTIQGFATDISYNFGERAEFKVDTDSSDYRVARPYRRTDSPSPVELRERHPSGLVGLAHDQGWSSSCANRQVPRRTGRFQR